MIKNKNQESNEHLFSIDLKCCAKNSAKVIKKARHRVISNIRNSKSYSKVDEKYVSRLIEITKQNSDNKKVSNMQAYCETDIQKDINCFVNTSRFCPKTVPTVQDKSLYEYAQGTGIEESVWLVNIIISPDGTFKIPDFDNKSGNLTEGSKESEEGDDEKWQRVSQELLKQYPTKHNVMGPEPESCNYNSLDDMPPSQVKCLFIISLRGIKLHSCPLIHFKCLRHNDLLHAMLDNCSKLLNFGASNKMEADLLLSI